MTERERLIQSITAQLPGLDGYTLRWVAYCLDQAEAPAMEGPACKECGAEVTPSSEKGVGVCEVCGTRQPHTA